MAYEILFAGVGGTVLGTLLGAIIAAKLTYQFQKKLLEQQLDFLKKQADEDLKFRQEIHSETLSNIQELRETLRIKIDKVAGHLFHLTGNSLSI